LGYPRFGAQGGDSGAMVSMALGGYHADHLVGIHVNFVVGKPPADASTFSDEDRRAIAAQLDWRGREYAYAQIQGTKPQTLGYGLNDSPAGQAAWIVEKFRAWSDCGGEV